MNRSTAGFATVTTGVVTLYLLGALVHASASERIPADETLTRGIGVVAGASALVFFCFLMRYLDALQATRTLVGRSSGPD